MDAAGILPGFTGRGMHDHWKSELPTPTTPMPCARPPHLRQTSALSMSSITKPGPRRWPGSRGGDQNRRGRGPGRRAPRPPAETRTGFAQRYDAVVEAGYTVNPRPPPVAEGKKRGRRPDPAVESVGRLRDLKAATVASPRFPGAVADNLAERDVRMVRFNRRFRGFRTTEGAQGFAQIGGIC